MVALATIAEAASMGYVLDPISGPMLLDRASARIRAYTGQTISRVIGDVAVIPIIRGVARLPQRPADKPITVLLDGVAFVEGTAWHWDPVRSALRCLSVHLPSANGPTDGWFCAERSATVTYSHGFVTIPQELVEVVCSVAARMASSPAGLAGGIRSETAGDVSVTYATESLSAAGALLPSEQGILDRLVGRRTTATLPLGSRW